MNVYIKTKVLFKFGRVRETVCGNEVQKAIQIATKLIHVKVNYVCTCSHTCEGSILYGYNVKLVN